MSARGANQFANDIFSGIVPPEPDHNYPMSAAIATHVDLDDSDALYIYVENHFGMPPQKFRQYCERLKEEFMAAMPGRTIIVGADDLKFTVISKKQEFKARLDGTLGEQE